MATNLLYQTPRGGLVTSMKNTRNHQNDDLECEVMDDGQAAVFLGVSTKSLRKLRKNKQIPFALVGGLIRYRRSALLAWIDAGGSNQHKGNE